MPAEKVPNDKSLLINCSLPFGCGIYKTGSETVFGYKTPQRLSLETRNYDLCLPNDFPLHFLSSRFVLYFYGNCATINLASYILPTLEDFFLVSRSKLNVRDMSLKLRLEPRL